ncbi:hypothetical protein [Cupriavidus sp. H19C3]|uniref:hypothetical protein n=1 Tax=Cupriavidus sp. H19C3 TaxID=3241603 RepID=UPI003BF81553
MIKKIITISAVLSLTACASVQSTLEKGTESLNKAVHNIGKPNTTPTTSTVTPSTSASVQTNLGTVESANVFYGKILQVKKKPDGVSLVVQLENGAVFSLPSAADSGFKVNQKVKVLQQGKQVSIQAI